MKLKIYISDYELAISDHLFKDYISMLPFDMRATILKYKRWQDRQATLFGKLLLLRELQSAYPDTWAQQIQSVKIQRYGKPFLPHGPEFSISHAGSIVVLAVTTHGVVGIDIEKIHDITLDDYLRYIPEVAHLRHYDPTTTHALFFDCWTQKEAVLKASGTGLSAPLEHVILQNGSALCDGTSWFLTRLHIANGYCSHVATSHKLEHVIIERVNLMHGMP